MAKLHFISDMSKQIVLFPQKIDEKIAENDPVRVLDRRRGNVVPCLRQQRPLVALVSQLWQQLSHSARTT